MGAPAAATQLGAEELNEPTDEDTTSIGSSIDSDFIHRHIADIFTILFYCVALSFLFRLVYMLVSNFVEYRHLILQSRDVGADEDEGFQMYLRYKFTRWFAWSPDAKGYVLFSIAFCFIVLFSGIFVFSTGKNLGVSVWIIFTQLVEPDGGKGSKTFEGKAVCGVASIASLIIFALLIAFVQDKFSDFLLHLRDGAEPVVEAGHIVMIGWTDRSMAVIRELCEAYEDRGGCRIAVLSELDKPTVEAEIRHEMATVHHSTVVVRRGKVHSAPALKMVGVDKCGRVLVMSNQLVPLEERDATVVRVLLTLRSHEWPRGDGRILVHCAQQKNKPLLEQMGGVKTDVVTVEDFVGRIIVQCSSNVGISTVMKRTLGFKDAEFYIQRAPKTIHGMDFRDAIGHFPDAVLAGVVTGPEGHRDFRWCKDCMEHDLRISADDEIMLFADDALGLEASAESAISQHHAMVSEDQDDSEAVLTYRKGLDSVRASAARKTIRKFESPRGNERDPSYSEEVAKKAETIVIIGWNEMIYHMLVGLDDTVGEGSKVVCYSQVPKATRAEHLERMDKVARMENTSKRWRALKDGVAGVVMEEGIIGSRFQLEKFIKDHALVDGIEAISRIFVLTDQAIEDERQNYVDPDSGVISTILHIRQILQELRPAQAKEQLPFQVSSRGVAKGTKSLELQRRLQRQTSHNHAVPIIAEIRDRETEEHCRELEVLDFVDSVTISAQVLAMLAYEPRLKGMLQEIISESGRMTFSIRDVGEYYDDPEEVPGEQDLTFFDVMGMALVHGELVLGWTQPRAAEEVLSSRRSLRKSNSFHEQVHAMQNPQTKNSIYSCSHDQLQWIMNPADKTQTRTWRTGHRGDRLAVLCERI